MNSTNHPSLYDSRRPSHEHINCLSSALGARDRSRSLRAHPSVNATTNQSMFRPTFARKTLTYAPEFYCRKIEDPAMLSPHIDKYTNSLPKNGLHGVVKDFSAKDNSSCNGFSFSNGIVGTVLPATTAPGFSYRQPNNFAVEWPLTSSSIRLSAGKRSCSALPSKHKTSNVLS